MEFYAKEVRENGDLRRFIRFPWTIYKNDPCWVPPLLGEMRWKLNPRKNPFLEYGQARFFLSFNDRREVVGRIAAIFNPIHCELRQERTGFFGLFECIHSVEVAKKLLKSANDYLSSFDCRKIIGPVNFNTNDEYGLLIEGHQESPMIMCNYALPYYHELLAACGFQKAMDLFSYRGKLGHSFPAKYMKVVQRVSANATVTVRPFDRRQRSRDIAMIREIYNQSFKEVWGFVPLSFREAEAMGQNMISFSDDELVWIADYNKKPVGFILALPDVNEILKNLNGRLFPLGIFKFLAKRRQIQGVRVVALAVLPEYRSIGIESLLIYRVHTRILAGGYQRAEFSVVNDNNTRMRTILEGLGFQAVKRYRLYQAPIIDQIPHEESPGSRETMA